MEKMEEPLDPQKVKKNLTGILIFILSFVLFFIVYDYYDLGNFYYHGEQFTTLDTKATDTPKYKESSKRKEERYLFKAQEFNGKFKIVTSGLEILKENIHLRDWIESSKRGDDLTIDIYESDKKNINGLYTETKVLGLKVNGRQIFTPKQIQTADKKTRERRLKTTVIIGVGILVLLLLVRIKK